MALPLADEGGSVALRAAPSLLAGLGLFAAGPGKPAPIEYRMDEAGPISADEEDTIWENKLPGHEYLMSVATVDDNGFRDETGKLRCKADAAAYVGRTVQELVWDSARNEWQIIPPLNYVGLLDPIKNPAAYANDALYQVLDGITQLDEYTRQDKLKNALVMVPALRRRHTQPAAQSAVADTAEGNDELHKTEPNQSCADFEFCSMWFYPRRGWSWTESIGSELVGSASTPVVEDANFGSELTVGYYWPITNPQPDAYAQFCSVA